MKRFILVNCLCLVILLPAAGQLGKDSFVFRNDMNVDYNLFVKNNDINSSQLKIISVLKIGVDTNLYSLEISSDSNYINIKSTSTALNAGIFQYTTLHGVSLDSTTVFFERKDIPADVFPGDCNKDNLVNHMDLFPIGLMFGQFGAPRNLSDTNISFGVPKKVGNWFYEIRGINGKHADVDGNGIINENDIIQLRRNFGKDKGNYLPVLSFASNDVKLELSIPDTVKLSSNSKLSIPIVIKSPNKISAYGLAFAYTVRIFDKNNISLSRFYPHTKYYRTNVWDEFSTLFLIDTTSYAEHTNIAYCKRNQSNGDLDPQGGIIDIIIEDILLGLPNPGDQTHINIYLKEVALIDKNYNTIPISPVSKRIYLQKASSSVKNTDVLGWSVHPTKIDHCMTLLNPLGKKAKYLVYNSLGQLISSGALLEKVELSTSVWPSGMYYIKNDHTSEVIKVQK